MGTDCSKCGNQAAKDWCTMPKHNDEQGDVPMSRMQYMVCKDFSEKKPASVKEFALKRPPSETKEGTKKEERPELMKEGHYCFNPDIRDEKNKVIGKNPRCGQRIW